MRPADAVGAVPGECDDVGVNEPTAPVAQVCQVCREPLGYFLLIDSRDGAHQGEWRHGHAADHEAVPVPRMETIQVNVICDFCSSPSPAGSPSWIYPTVAFAGGSTDALAHIRDEGDGWGACDRCARLIEAGDYDGLRTRAASILARRNNIPSSQFDTYAAGVGAVFETFRAARSGPRVLADPVTGRPVPDQG